MRFKAGANQLLAFATAFLFVASGLSIAVHLTVLAQEEGTECYTCSKQELCITVNDGWEVCTETNSGGERECDVSGDECHQILE